MDGRWAYHATGDRQAADQRLATVMKSTPPSQPLNDHAPGWLSLPAMRYPNAYVWFLFFSSLDVMLTWAILARHGTEVNPIAAQVIELWGLPGAIAFKFSLMLFVVIVCEVVGRSRDRQGRFLIWLAVIVSAVPVVYSLGLLVMHTMSMVQ